jgi:hypothetical protein
MKMETSETSLPGWMAKILECVKPEHHDWLQPILAQFAQHSEKLTVLRAELDRTSRDLLDGSGLHPSIGYFLTDIASAAGSAGVMQRKLEECDGRKG